MKKGKKKKNCFVQLTTKELINAKNDEVPSSKQEIQRFANSVIIVLKSLYKI